MTFALFTTQIGLGSVLLLVVVVAAFAIEHAWRRRIWTRQAARQEREFEQLHDRLDGAMALLNEKLDGHLRILVLTDGKAKESIAAVEASLHRLETMEVRISAHEHRIAIIERAQELVLDAARTLERARDR